MGDTFHRPHCRTGDYRWLNPIESGNSHKVGSEHVDDRFYDQTG